MKFVYKGRDKDRKIVKGEIEAPSSRDAIIMLKKNHDVVILFSLKKKIEIPVLEKLKSKVAKTYLSLSEKVKISAPQKSFSEIHSESLSRLLKKIEDIASNKSPGGKVMIDIFVRDSEPEEPFPYEEEFLEKPKFKQHTVRKEKTTEYKLDWSLINNEQRLQSKNGKLKVPKREIEIFTKRLAVLLESGISLTKALMILQDTRNKNFKIILQEIYNDVQNGHSLSYALSKFPKHFDSVYVALVSVGESSGALSKCLKDILQYQQQKGKITKKMKSAMVYPTIILSVILTMMVLGSLFFIPMFKGLFESLNMELPFITRALFWVSDRIVFIIMIPIALIFILNLLRKTNKKLDWLWRLNKDRLMLRLPVIKESLQLLYMYQFANTMALILKNGIKMLDGIKLTENVINNVIIKSEIRDVTELILKGATLSEALSNQEHFDPLMSNIVYTGEESGRIHYILEEIAQYYRENLEQRIEILVEMIQPMSIILIAIVIIPVVFALFLPILDLSTGKFLKN